MKEEKKVTANEVKTRTRWIVEEVWLTELREMNSVIITQ